VILTLGTVTVSLNGNFTQLLQIWPCCFLQTLLHPIAALIAAMLLLLFAHMHLAFHDRLVVSA